MIAISRTDLKGLCVLNGFLITLFKFDFIVNTKMEFTLDLMWCKYDRFRGSMRQLLWLKVLSYGESDFVTHNQAFAKVGNSVILLLNCV